METEKTLVIIKPDGVERNLQKEIIKKYEDVGLKLLTKKEMTATSEFLKKHYEAHIDKPFYNKLEIFMSSGPVVAIVFEGKDAVSLARKITGTTNPIQAESGTVRADFRDKNLKGETAITKNLVHASATKKEAKKELKLWFPDFE